MSIPEPMPCLADDCPSPLRCSGAGGCIESRKDSYRSTMGAIAACRERKVYPKSWLGEERAL